MSDWWVWPAIAGLAVVTIVLSAVLAYVIHLLTHRPGGF